MRVHAALAIAAAVAVPSAARADGDVTIHLTPDGARLADDLGMSPAELESTMEDELADFYETANVEGFLRAFANATSFASRGVGVDYAPQFRGLELGITANVAAAAEGFESDEEVAGGIAPNLSIFAGLSLAAWGYDQIRIYANGFHYSTSLDNVVDEVAGLRGSITNVGLHVQYHVLPPGPDASSLLLLWNGVHLTTGIEVSRWSIGLDNSLDYSFEVEGDGLQVGTIDTSATGTFDLSSTSTTIPLEITTGARLLYFAGLYVGAGVDLQLGRASADAALDVALTGTDPESGDEVDVGTADVTIDGSDGPSPFLFHLLTGVELNLWRLKLFTQATVVPVKGASLAFGLRLRI